MDALKCLLVSLALVLVVVISMTQAAEEVREWKTADGTRTLQAEYVSSGDGKVTIKRSQDGKTFTIELDTLSEEDREWVGAKEKEIAASGPREVSERFADLISGEWERTEGHGLQYRIYGDRKLRRSEEGGYPLVVYLHGRTMDVMTDDEPWLARDFSNEENYRDRSCFIIAPQNPDHMGWNGEKADGVVAIVKELIEELPVDAKRVYLTGYSMGGFGTFRIIADEPELFAAGVPVAGGGSPGTASTIKHVPFWVFHGAKDPTVDVSKSRDIVEALKGEGVDVKYTEYPDGDHGIAGQVYADKEMHEWLFEQSR
ncbi:MAG: prolyl oligopeptidase family serine peptidase [Verrucomicrobiota bacterium]